MEVTNETFMAAVADACRAGIESEQERIIKLIENYKAPCECGSLYITVCYAHRLIALIKGEK